MKWYFSNVKGQDVPFPISLKRLKSIRRDAKGRDRGQVDALVWADVERVCAFAEADKSVAGLRDSAMIRLMSDCLLRVSEVVAVNCGHFKQNTLIVQRSKTDQQGEGVALYVTSDTRNAISKYKEKAEITRGALFRPIRRGGHIQTGRLTDVSARHIIKNGLQMPRSLTYKWQVDGRTHRCRHIMLAQRWLNAPPSQGIRRRIHIQSHNREAFVFN